MDVENNRNELESSNMISTNQIGANLSTKSKKRVSSFESVTKYLESVCANYNIDDIDDSDNWSLKSFNSNISENELSNRISEQVSFSIGEESYNSSFDNVANKPNLIKDDIHHISELSTAKLRFLKKNKYNILQWLSKTSYPSIDEDKTDKMNDIMIAQSCSGLATINLNDENLPNLLKPKKESALRDINTWAPSCY